MHVRIRKYLIDTFKAPRVAHEPAFWLSCRREGARLKDGWGIEGRFAGWLVFLEREPEGVTLGT